MLLAEIELWKAIVLGAVQGVAELLPISSSAHLVLVPWCFGWQDPGLTFDVALHLGTLAAILIYFWTDLWGMATALLRGIATRRPLAEPNSRLALYVIVASIPGAVFGALLDSTIEERFHVENASGGALLAIAAALIVMGLLMAVAERVALHRRALGDLGWRDAIVVGAARRSRCCRACRAPAPRSPPDSSSGCGVRPPRASRSSSPRRSPVARR